MKTRRSRIAVVEFGMVLAGLTLLTMAGTRIVRFEAFQKGTKLADDFAGSERRPD